VCALSVCIVCGSPRVGQEEEPVDAIWVEGEILRDSGIGAPVGSGQAIAGLFEGTLGWSDCGEGR
jgi:hypothetical protein